jgi:hypothetical protein
MEGLKPGDRTRVIVADAADQLKSFRMERWHWKSGKSQWVLHTRGPGSAESGHLTADLDRPLYFRLPKAEQTPAWIDSR